MDSTEAARGERLRLLVTGAGGQLGRDVMRCAAERGHETLGADRQALDITDADAVLELVRSWKPDAIVHCAAWTAVDDAEEQRDDAFLVNETGSRNVALAARDAGAYVIAVSTDYVFDGTNPQGYAEDDPTSPINAYGASKLAGEVALLEAHPDGAAVARTAWLFGAEGQNFVLTIAKLAAGRSELDVVEDQVGSPTWTGHLSAALVECCERRLTGILHLAGTPVASWYELARDVVAVTGAECEVRPTTSDRFPRPAPRPACSILRVTRPETPAMGDWHDGVRAVLAAASQPTAPH